MTGYDVAIVGAGMAGASLAAAIGARARVVLIEAEEAPGYHATGRSAAFWSETYGGPGVQPLTTASGPFLQKGGFLHPSGALHIGRAEDAAAVGDFVAAFAGSGIVLDSVDPANRIAGLRADWTLGVAEPSSTYIDVAALHAACLAAARRAGAVIATRAPLRAAVRDRAGWSIAAGDATYRAGILVNAAGAWADAVAIMAGASPLGVQPYRRTMIQLRTDPPVPADLPLVVDISGRFYFKAAADGRLWLSPHDETPCPPCDAQPEELDIALAIDRLEQVVDWRVTGLERRWAGLRSFAPDRLPVYGFDPRVPGFFWCAGQGGFGIQTAPAASALAAALLLGAAPDDSVAAIDPARYAPDRFVSLA
jgi:D-arginine dehydrogenase